MDLNQLLHRHQVSLMQLDRAENPEERRAHTQFVSEFAEKIQNARDELGAPARLRASLAHRRVADEPSGTDFGQGVCLTARVVLIPSEDLPYAVVFSHDREESSRHPFRTMREAEAHIRQIMPTPDPRSTLYDRQSEQD